MEKDIFYPNHHNAFFIDENLDNDNFKLICGYEKPILNNGSIENIWKIQNVDFSELTFGDNYRVYWFDYEKELEFVKKELRSAQIYAFEELWQSQKNDGERRKAFIQLLRILEVQSDVINDFELIALIDCLYSIKFKKVIGYKYPKLIQLLHQFFQKDLAQKSHFGEYALKAIGTYGAKDQVLQEDGTRKFRDKAKRYVNHRFYLSHKYDRILKLLFPELFQSN